MVLIAYCDSNNITASTKKKLNLRKKFTSFFGKENTTT